MNRFFVRSLFVAVSALTLGTTAHAQGAASSAASAASGTVTRVGNAINHGAQVAASGVERGINAAASGIERGGKAVTRVGNKVAEKVSGSSPAASSSY